MASVLVQPNGTEIIFKSIQLRQYKCSGNAKMCRIVRIELPKGSIRRLIGYDLTPKDKPVELPDKITEK